jgi:hypothetical protein
VTSITLRRSATDLAVKLKFASGLPGVPGEASDLQEGSVTTLDASADASFSITGTPPNQILNLSLPRGMTGPVGEGSGGLFFESRAAAASATIGTGIKTVRTAGFASAGDGGHGLYKRLQIAPTLTTNPRYFRSTDRLRADFTTDATNGGWWELVIEAGAVRIEQFGGVNDGTPRATTGTDNVQPFRDALAIVTHTILSYPVGPDILVGGGTYYISDTLEVRRGVRIRGIGRGHDDNGSGSNLQFANNKTGFLIQSTNTVGAVSGVDWTFADQTGQGSIFEGLVLRGGGTDVTKHGFHLRARATIRECSCFEFPGKAININASNGNPTTNGNANQWRVQDCISKACVSGGLWVEGNDANAGVCDGFETSGGGGAGVCDISGLGNAYHGLNIAGYGNGGVTYGGSNYQCGTPDPAVAAATTPGTNPDIWYELRPGTADANFPTWSATPTSPYILKVPIYCGGGSNTSLFDGIYVEGGGTICDISQARTIAISGQTEFTRRSAYLKRDALAPSIFSQSGIGASRNYVSGTAAFTYNGGQQFAYVGRFDSDTAGLTILEHRRDSSEGGISYKWKYDDTSNNETWYGLGGPGSGYQPVFICTTLNTTRKFGRPFTGVPHKMVFNDFGIQDSSGGADMVLHSLRAAAPLAGTAPGEYGQGSVIWNKAPTAGGTMGWVCTQTGVLADLWVTGTNYGAGTYVVNSGGKYYKLTTDGPGNSTVQPTHGSGEVIGGDGYGWTWLSNVPAVWKTFGAIAA